MNLCPGKTNNRLGFQRRWVGRATETDVNQGKQGVIDQNDCIAVRIQACALVEAVSMLGLGLSTFQLVGRQDV